MEQNNSQARGSGINPQILQQMLDSAANAAEKGQSQFFTPLDTGRALAQALPKVRPCLVDLNCGGTALLQASASADTEVLLGSDIDPVRPKVEGLEKLRPVNRITQDLTRLYPLLKEVDFKADLFVLNPPWRLWWYRDRLKDLAQSDVTAVRDAFANLEDGAARKGTVDGTIDSTIATLMIALDLMDYQGEGMLIANNATLERLIFTPGAPHSALAKHIWGHLVIPGNPMTGIDDCLWEKFDPSQPSTKDNQQFCTGVIYFAVGHTSGPTQYHWPTLPDRLMRMGNEVRWNYGHHQQKALDPWNCVKDRLAELEGKSPRNPHNLWLSVTGRIRTNLSSFEQRSVKVDKQEAERLHKLEGKTPMELVLQRAQRDELMHVVERGGWRVEPALIAAVQAAVADYHSQRAPLYPLPDIQRLGYLDEQDVIECKKDLLGIKAPVESDKLRVDSKKPGADHQPSTKNHQLIFRAGEKYSIRTQTVQVTRTSLKFNPFMGREDEMEHTGQELAIYIADRVLDPGSGAASPSARTKNPAAEYDEYCFMDQKIKADESTQVTNTGKRQRYGSADTIAIDFTLQQLAEHFIIPDVPDVASANPAGYQRHLELLTEIERITEAFA